MIIEVYSLVDGHRVERMKQSLDSFMTTLLKTSISIAKGNTQRMQHLSNNTSSIHQQGTSSSNRSDVDDTSSTRLSITPCDIHRALHHWQVAHMFASPPLSMLSPPTSSDRTQRPSLHPFLCAPLSSSSSSETLPVNDTIPD
jgi:hypothetical protein